MRKIAPMLFAMVLLPYANALAQRAEKVIDLKGGDEALVLTGDAHNEWAVILNQGAKVRATTVKPNGTLGKIKTLVKVKGFAVELLSAAYDPLNDRYLVLYKTYDGKGKILLKSKIFSGTLQRIGKSQLIETLDDKSGNVCPQVGVVHDPVNQRYLVSWIERNCGLDSKHSVLKTGLLSKDGALIPDNETLIDKRQHINFEYLRLVRNPATGVSLVMLKQLDGKQASIVGYRLNANGRLISKKPVILASTRVADLAEYDLFSSVPAGAFVPTGTGIATWADNIDGDDFLSNVKITARLLSPNGKPAAEQKIIASASPNQLSTTSVYDPGRARFLTFWTEGNIRGVAIDPATLTSSTFSIPTDDPDSVPIVMGAAYESSSQKILIVWNSVCYNPFFPQCSGSYGSSQLQAAILSNSER